MDLMFNVQYVFFFEWPPWSSASLPKLASSPSKRFPKNARLSQPPNEVPSHPAASNDLGQLHISLVLQLHKLWHSSSLDCQLLG